MSDGRWRITVTTPDWGQDHLSLDAIVAYVDDELDHGPQERATRHIAQCAECEAQIIAQGQTRSALRTAGGPVLPSALLSNLRSIPQSAELPPPPAGLAITRDGHLVSVLRPDAPPAPDVAETRDSGTGTQGAPGTRGVPSRQHRPVRRTPVQRRLRVGTCVAVSGIALGALAFGVPAASTGDPALPASPVGGPSFGGSAISAVDTGAGGSGPVDAQFRLERRMPLTRSPVPEPERVEGLLDMVPGSFYGLP